MNLFKPSQLSIRPTIFKDIYLLRISQNASIMKDGRSANTSLYGDKKTVAKAFHKALKELKLPKDRLNWKQIDMGKMTWEINSK